MSELLGKKVGNYVLRSSLGVGGMGHVYLAEHRDIEHNVAIKLVSPELTNSPQASERFIAEAKALARIKHPNIVSIYDFGRMESGALYLVMELLEGEELQDLLATGKKMSAAEVLPYLEQLCSGLYMAHCRGAIHRDLKPSNIFVTARDPLHVKIIDFGLAKQLDHQSADEEGITTTGQVMGSPVTIAPEQASGWGKRIGPATDIYALGVIVYWMLAGRPPFHGGGRQAVIANHILTPPPNLKTFCEISDELNAVVAASLIKEPEKRISCAREFLTRFAEAAGLGISTSILKGMDPNASTGKFGKPSSALSGELSSDAQNSPRVFAGGDSSGPHTSLLESGGSLALGTTKGIQTSSDLESYRTINADHLDTSPGPASMSVKRPIAEITTTLSGAGIAAGIPNPPQKAGGRHWGSVLAVAGFAALFGLSFYFTFSSDETPESPVLSAAHTTARPAAQPPASAQPTREAPSNESKLEEPKIKVPKTTLAVGQTVVLHTLRVRSTAKRGRCELTVGKLRVPQQKTPCAYEVEEGKKVQLRVYRSGVAPYRKRWTVSRPRTIVLRPHSTHKDKEPQRRPALSSPKPKKTPAKSPRSPEPKKVKLGPGPVPLD